MKKLLCRYLVLFLVFWAGLALHDSWESIRSWWRNDGEVTRLNAGMKELQLEKKRLELAVCKGEDATDLIHRTVAEFKLLKENGKLFWANEQETASLERQIEDIKAKKGARLRRIPELEQECAALERECKLARERQGNGQGGHASRAAGIALLAALQLHALEAFCYTCCVFLAMLALRLLCYFAFAPLVEGCDPVCPCGHSEEGETEQTRGEEGVKLATIPLPPGEALLVRDESYTGGYMEYDNGLLQKRTQLLFSREYWLMSWLCGLCLLTRFTNPAGGVRTHDITITSDDPDEYFSTFTLQAGRRCYISPSDLVAFTGGVRIYARWRAWLPAWCMGQIRYYVLTGNGAVVVRAEGGITAQNLKTGETAVRKRHSLISASQGVRLHVRRTETLLPFLLGNASLFDLRLQGNGCFRMRNAVTRPRSLTERASHVFLESLGKFLGF